MKKNFPLAKCAKSSPDKGYFCIDFRLPAKGLWAGKPTPAMPHKGNTYNNFTGGRLSMFDYRSRSMR